MSEYAANVFLFSYKAPFKWTEKEKQRYELLKQQSGNINSIHVDITNSNSFLQEIENIENRYGQINGIIHAARNTEIKDIELVSGIDQDSLKKHFSLRVDGLLNIKKIVKEKNVDFVKVVSSLSSFLGGISYGAYASASAQMDNLVLQEDTNWTVLNLDRIQENSDQWIDTEELLKAFKYSFLYKNIKQIIVSKRNLNNPVKNIDNKETPKNDVAVNRKVLKTSFAAPQSETESKLVLLFENMFGVNGLGVEDNFFELGGDSLKAVMLINKLKNDFGVMLTISEIFSSKTIIEISKLIDQENWIKEDISEREEIDTIVI